MTQVIANNGVAALESEPTQFFQHPDGSDVGIAFQKLSDVVLEWIEQTLAWLPLLGRRARSGGLMLGDDLGDRLTVDSELLRNAALRGSAVEHPNDLVACRFVHRCHTPSPCRRYAPQRKRHRATVFRNGVEGC